MFPNGTKVIAAYPNGNVVRYTRTRVPAPSGNPGPIRTLFGAPLLIVGPDYTRYIGSTVFVTMWNVSDNPTPNWQRVVGIADFDGETGVVTYGLATPNIGTIPE